MEWSYLLIGVFIEMEQKAAGVGASILAFLGASRALSHSALVICRDFVVGVEAVPPGAPTATKQWVGEV